MKKIYASIINAISGYKRYSSSYHKNRIVSPYLFKPVLLLFLFIGFFSRYAHAQNVFQATIDQLREESRAVGNGDYDVHGPWAEFVIPYFTYPLQIRLTSGTLYVTPEGGSEMKIASIRFSNFNPIVFPLSATAKIMSHNNYALAIYDETHVETEPYPPVTDWLLIPRFSNGIEYSVTDPIDHSVPAEAFIRWYVPQNMLNKNLTFRYEAKFSFNSSTISINKTFEKTFRFSPVPKATVSFAYSGQPGWLNVKYSFDDPFKYVTHYSLDSQSFRIGKPGDQPTDSMLIKIDNILQGINLHNYIFPPEMVYPFFVVNQPIIVPAYVWPDSLFAEYDGRDTITLNWQVNKISGKQGIDYIGGEKFEVGRSTDSTFSDETKIQIIGSPKYDPNQEQYSIVDDKLRSLRGKSHVYYRLRRTESKEQWGWDEYRDADINIPIDTALVGDTVELWNTSDGPEAHIRFHPFTGLWTDNTTFKIEKTNVTKGELVQTFDLTEAEARSGEYIDSHIPYCNEFSYTLVAEIGNDFPSPEKETVPGSILAVDIGNISALTVSKGYFPDRTVLQWHSQGMFDNFIIKRRVYGSADPFVQVASIDGTSTTEIKAIDDKGAPGVYYEYLVKGAVECNHKIKYSNALTAVGFRSPTGNLYGRITYENGQAVKEATVQLENTSGGNMGRSIYLNGTENSYLKIDSLHTVLSDSTITISAWIKPDEAHPTNAIIFKRETQYELGFDKDGKLYFSYNGQKVSCDYTHGNGSFVHIAGIHSGDTLMIMINDVVKITGQITFQPSANPVDKVTIGGDASGNVFKGFVDEVRIWNVALADSVIRKNYKRLLTGGEKGLAAYWKLDETIDNAFYDLAHQGDLYHKNDGRMDPEVVGRSGVIPSDSQLGLKAYTDSTGNYIITGIPYTGVNGTTYKIFPLFEGHQFDPVSVSRLYAAGAANYTINFTDISSYEVSGKVMYNNTTIPVEGASFKIDGVIAQDGKGTILKTDATGHFSIRVPVGIHEVKAIKNNHVFVNQGRIVGLHGEDLNYQQSQSKVEIYDSTTVRLIGRVAGGYLQQNFPLGHSLSTNNLGETLSIKLQLPSLNKYDLCSSDTTVYRTHYIPPYSDSSVVHKTKIKYSLNDHSITIYPDTKTGEFVADLLPVQYIVGDVHATGWGNILIDDKGNLNSKTIDLSNKFVTQNSIYNHKDSTRISDTSWQYYTRSDTVDYNDSYQFIKRVKPELAIVQQINNETIPYFGDTSFVLTTLDGSTDTIHVIDQAKSGSGMYVLSHPVFLQGKTYHFLISSNELYPFYVDEQKTIKEKDGKQIIDQVPSQDGTITLYNYLKNGATTAEILSLDSNGKAPYVFTAGDPDFSAKGMKDFSASVKIGAATNINWKWNGQSVMKAFVMGAIQSGTDFVTSGPDKILTVLRDPPGNNSYSYLKSGSSFSTTTSHNTIMDTTSEVSETLHLGGKVVTWTGVGAGTIITQEVVADISGSVMFEQHKLDGHGSTSVFTTTTDFQTSNDPTFVGAPADLFVGYSTNLTFGTTNNLVILRGNVQANDKILFATPDSSFLVVQQQGIGIGEHFKTLFAYPQQHIVKVLIPELIHLRNSLLWLPDSASTTDPQLAANNLGRVIYVSKLSQTDKNFGKSNIDSIAFPSTAAPLDSFWNGPSYTIYYPDSSIILPDSALVIDSIQNLDSVMLLNQYIAGWEEQLKENEKAKLNTTLLQNYSFHAGSPVTYEKTSSKGYSHTENFNTVVHGGLNAKLGFTVLKIGTETSVKGTSGKTTNDGTTTVSDTTTVEGFTLASSGTDEYLSVDVSKSKEDNGFVFTTKGGATGCPYEGALKTKYYQEGKLINQPTLRIEVPKIAVDSAIVNNVPSSRVASYTLYLRNASEAELPATFILTYANTDDIQGAYIAVDGSTIAGGRSFAVQPGQTITKVLTLKKGPNALDYNNIPIILHSSCQYDPNGYQELIADTVLISAHFIPSCTDIRVAQPSDQWVMNTRSPVMDSNKTRPYIPVVLNKFDVTNSLFDHIALQYKPSASSGWITSMNFYVDKDKYDAAEGDKQMIENAEGINYSLEMADGVFNDQPYDIRALSVCQLGPGNFVKTTSNVVSGIRDTYSPRQFGTTQPADGILDAGDNIRLDFNEPVAAGLMTDENIRLEGILNGAPNDHSVSVYFDGKNDEAVSDFDKNLQGKDITISMWILPDHLQNATLFSQGDKNNAIELAITKDEYLAITLNQQIFRSQKTVSYDDAKWAQVALTYHAKDSTLSAFYNGIEVLPPTTAGRFKGIGKVVLGRSIQKENGNFYAGKMHDVQIWTRALSSVSIIENGAKRLSGSENGLLAYYPMTEGQGNIIYDKAHGNHVLLTGTWNTPAGKAIEFNGDGYVKMKSGSIPLTSDMNYTISLWFKAPAGQTNATLVSNGKGDGTDAGGSENLFSLGFENGLITYRNNGKKIQIEGSYLDDSWHHLAIAVNKTTNILQIFVDGRLKKYAATDGLGGIASAFTYLGCRAWYDQQDAIKPHYDQFFTGEIDDYRLWNTYLDHTYLENHFNVRLSGDEMGLLAYYPFETYAVSPSNVVLMDTTIRDLKLPDANGGGTYADLLHTDFSNDMAPLKDRGPVVPLNFSYVVNNDALIINLEEQPVRTDKTLVTIRVGGVYDKHGNELQSPITWTAFIDQNPLDWSDEEINLSKDINKSLQFETYIINNGGREEKFHLANLPVWLTADIMSGSVAPKGKQKITFTINKGLNVGKYDNVIEMINNLQETQGLALNLKVIGNTPDWKVNPADFEYNMSLYGKIRVKGIFSDDPEDILAAFHNGKCVGVVNNTYFKDADLWYSFLTIYSDSVQIDGFEFRIWDASTGKVYTGVPVNGPISFSNGDIVGSPAQPVIFDGKELIFQNIPLVSGWNWISFNLTGSNFNNINTTLGNGDWQSGDIIKLNNVGFAAYSATASAWVAGKLTSFDNLSSYMLQAHHPQTLSIGGTAVDVSTTYIPVKGQQWNYIGYLPQENMTVKDALAGYMAGEGDVIKSQTGFSMYDPSLGWVGNLNYMEPGKGYMLYRNGVSDTTFRYPEIPGILRLAKNNDLNSARLNPYETPITENYAYENNMTVLAAVSREFHLLPGDEILAYAGDELRSKAKAMQNPMTGQPAFFFNIAGKNNQQVHFEVKRGSEIIARTGPVLNYGSNLIAGTPQQPLMLRFEKQGFKAGVSPNPFHDRLMIRLSLPDGNHKIQWRVYNLNGQLVFASPQKTVNGKSYFTQWNGRNGSGVECPPGVYLINITVDGKPSSYKVIKY